jgi:hypothetical protein
MKTSTIFTLDETIYYWGDEIKEDEMRGTSSTHGELRNAYNILL